MYAASVEQRAPQWTQQSLEVVPCQSFDDSPAAQQDLPGHYQEMPLAAVAADAVRADAVHAATAAAVVGDAVAAVAVQAAADVAAA